MFSKLWDGLKTLFVMIVIVGGAILVMLACIMAPFVIGFVIVAGVVYVSFRDARP